VLGGEADDRREHRGRGEDAGGEALQLGELGDRDRREDDEDDEDRQAAQEAKPRFRGPRDL
jgi:hypothetical protein